MASRRAIWITTAAIDLLVTAQDVPLAYLHNRTGGGHSLTLQPRRNNSNRDAVGARVTVVTGKRRQVRWRIGGGSYQSGPDPRLHCGLGTATVVDSLGGPPGPPVGWITSAHWQPTRATGFARARSQRRWLASADDPRPQKSEDCSRALVTLESNARATKVRLAADLQTDRLPVGPSCNMNIGTCANQLSSTSSTPWRSKASNIGFRLAS